jgi:YebC/PmpR family DNA-binding regulatory protein
MGGHSHWSQIKRQKASQDAKRGELFTKLAREITVAAREGGPDSDLNPRLRLAIEKAREYNMPMDNVERAIKKATGQGEDAGGLQGATFEGYGPGGVAIMVDVVTDNRNRAVQELRTTFARSGGSLGETGCVGWVFETAGLIAVEPGQDGPEDIALRAIDAGAEDVRMDDDRVEVYSAPDALDRVRRALREAGLAVTSADLTKIPKTTVSLDEKSALQVLKLLDALEELDDVQKVYSNAEFPDVVLLEYAGHS